jgi:hypothetical protein
MQQGQAMRCVMNNGSVRLRARIVDDEALARARVKGMLAIEPDVEVAGECANVVKSFRCCCALELEGRTRIQALASAFLVFIPFFPAFIPNRATNHGLRCVSLVELI